ncbi:hypothetical protein [Granulicella mallensis]|uniref:Uncharacterized protein n=1 Tax=Granulicella mallensis TaxID=940614 RepID=A0A7W8EBI6_9BACT|nr:hypothetical protein [Granulicella mallensis]MBB5064550.1 hypothetical protein [Granulicella mallensis]
MFFSTPEKHFKAWAMTQEAYPDQKKLQALSGPECHMHLMLRVLMLLPLGYLL